MLDMARKAVSQTQVVTEDLPHLVATLDPIVAPGCTPQTIRSKTGTDGPTWAASADPPPRRHGGPSADVPGAHRPRRAALRRLRRAVSCGIALDPVAHVYREHDVARRAQLDQGARRGAADHPNVGQPDDRDALQAGTRGHFEPGHSRFKHRLPTRGAQAAGQKHASAVSWDRMKMAYTAATAVLTLGGPFASRRRQP